MQAPLLALLPNLAAGKPTGGCVAHACVAHLGWLVLWESRVLACTQEDIRGTSPKAGAKVANGWMIASRSHKAGCGHEALCVRLVRSERGWM